MVNVSAYRVVETEEGDKYIRLIFSGDLEMVRSVKAGNFYATVKQLPSQLPSMKKRLKK